MYEYIVISLMVEAVVASVVFVAPKFLARRKAKKDKLSGQETQDGGPPGQPPK